VPAPSAAPPRIERVPTLADDRPTVASLRPGAELDGVFACARKDRLTARSGSPYLALELRDRTGSIPARAFRDADFMAGRFDRGDLVHVKGRVDRFRDELQVEVRAIERADGAGLDPAAFLPVAYRDMEELDGFLEHLAREVHDRDLLRLLGLFLDDDAFRESFRRAPCSRSGHHAYLGGLIEHTVAVATLAQEACILHPRLDSDLLLSAAILHDVGKTREFELGAEISLSDEGALLGHLQLGQVMVMERAAQLAGFPPARLLALCHCVLGHHGPDPLPGRRFGSPEAMALARLNAVDAAVKGALEHGLP
jgi:3'-5' exoribonuclease